MLFIELFGSVVYAVCNGVTCVSAGKRKYDGGHQNQGGESKRRPGAAAAAAAAGSGWES